MRIAPRSAAIVNADRLVRLKISAEVFRRSETDLAEWHAHIGMQLTFDVNAAAVRQVVAAVLDCGGIWGGIRGYRMTVRAVAGRVSDLSYRVEGVFGGYHKGGINLEARKANGHTSFSDFLVFNFLQQLGSGQFGFVEKIFAVPQSRGAAGLSRAGAKDAIKTVPPSCGERLQWARSVSSHRLL